MYLGLLCKLIGAGLVIFAAVAFARETNGNMKKRLAQLVKLYGILNRLKSDLKYLNHTLPECFSDYAKNADPPFNQWFANMETDMNEERINDFSKIWSNGLKFLAVNSVLAEEDIEMLNGLKDKLGSYDVEASVKSIDYVLLQLEERRQELLSKAGERQKVVVSLSLFVGLMTVLLLI